MKGKNKIVAIDTWAISVLRHDARLINWNKEEVQKLDRKTRKMMTIYGALHPKAMLTGFMYQEKKEEQD